MSASRTALPLERSSGSADGGRRRVSRAVTALVVTCGALSSFAASASAATSNITIIPTYDSSVSSLPNFADIQTAINTDIANTEALITAPQPVSLTITFSNIPDGLGASGTIAGTIAYSQYRAGLKANPSKSLLQRVALLTMPVGPSTNINGATQVTATAADLAAQGVTLVSGSIPGDISVNFAITDPVRPIGPTLYDLQAVVQHEMDELLGIGGQGSTLGTGAPSGTPLPTTVGPLDLFRYHSPFVRSFTFSTSTTAYFSYTGGLFPVISFNQQGGVGSDEADWDSSVPTVQNAFGTPGSMPELGRAEMIAFEVVGYNLTAAGQQLLDSQAGQPAPAPLVAGQAPLNGRAL